MKYKSIMEAALFMPDDEVLDLKTMESEKKVKPCAAVDSEQVKPPTTVQAPAQN